MSEQLKIKVKIADRVYPLTIRRYEEESIRIATKKIEEIVCRYEENYAVKDKQDLLAMCALQLATRLEKVAENSEEEQQAMHNKLHKVERALRHALQ